MRSRIAVLWSLAASLLGPSGLAAQVQLATDVPYVPTPPEVVRAMLEVARVSPSDLVYDLGSGDGRIVIAAARDFGARGIGVDNDPQRVAEARANARRARVGGQVEFREQDLFETDIREASVVTLYLLPMVNFQLRPKLLRDLRPGTRIVSHAFGMDTWRPDSTLEIGMRRVYYWVVPARVEGDWGWEVDGRRFTAQLRQEFQQVEGTVRVGALRGEIEQPRLQGDSLSFELSEQQDGRTVRMRYQGRVEGDRIQGTVTIDGGPQAGTHSWTASRRVG